MCLGVETVLEKEGHVHVSTGTELSEQLRFITAIQHPKLRLAVNWWLEDS